jgi:HPt (histidine-containing phosphotransfer) domain-containing protein
VQVVSETFEKARTEQLQLIRTALQVSNVEVYFFHDLHLVRLWISIDGLSSQKGDAADAHFHAHSIKGASATIGFDGLSKAAKALDDLVKGGTVEGAMPLTEDLQEQLNLAIEYWERHTQALANALERCGDDQELFYQIAKEMVQDVIPSQVWRPFSCTHTPRSPTQ